MIEAFSPSTTYAFRVYDYDSAHGTGMSVYTNVATVTTPAFAKSPSALRATAVSGSQAVNLTWTDSSTDETGFAIQRSVDQQNWATVTTTAADVTAYTDGPLAGGDYYYRVCATKAEGDSGFSGVASAELSYVAPTIAAAASAEQQVVIGTTDELHVLGAVVGGPESSLTYRWSVLSGASVSFSPASGNAAKDTAATFSQPGQYTIRATISNGIASVSSDVQVTVQQTLASIAVTSASDAVLPDGTLQLRAVAYDQFSDEIDPQPDFTWSISSGGGRVDSKGLYTAPSDEGTATVQVTSGDISGKDEIAIRDALYRVTLTTPGLDSTDGDQINGLSLTNSGWLEEASPRDAVERAVAGTASHIGSTFNFPADVVDTSQQGGFMLSGLTGAADSSGTIDMWDAADLGYDIHWNVSVQEKPKVSLTAFRTGGNFGTRVAKDDQKSEDPNNYAILVDTDVLDPSSGDESSDGYDTAPIQGDQVVAMNGNAPDHSLAQLSFGLSPQQLKTGTVQITLSDPDAVRLFTDNGALFYDQSRTGSSPLTADLANPSGYLAGLSGGTADLWMEGMHDDPDLVITIKYIDASAGVDVSEDLHVKVIAINYEDQSGGSLNGVSWEPPEDLLAAANEYDGGNSTDDTSALMEDFQSNLNASEFHTILKGIDALNVTQLTEGGQVLNLEDGTDPSSAATEVELADSERALDSAGATTVGQQIGGKVVPIFAPIVLKTVMDVLTDVLPANQNNAELNFYFDGTGNNGPLDTKVGMETNVFGMQLEDGHDHHYFSGVGTQGNGLTKSF